LPKSKPTQVIVHRIELQQTERELLETLVITKSIRNMIEPAVAVAGAYVAYKTAFAIHDWGEDVYSTIKKNMVKAKEMRREKMTLDSFENPLKNDGFSEDGTPVNIFGVPGWGIWPGYI